MNELFSSIELPLPTAFAAGETKVFYLSGSYFELIDCPSPVDVILSDRSGGVRARMIGAAQTHHIKQTPYAIIQITSATAQTIRFAYGSGEAGTRNTAGSVNILNAVALDAPTLAALESVDLNAASQDMLRRPMLSSANYKAKEAVAALTAQQVFAPAANVNGAIILSAGFFSAAASSASPVTTLLAKAAVPATVIDGEVLLTAENFSIGTSCYESGQLPKEQLLGPGLGLYWISDLAVTAASTRHCRYRLL